MSKTPRRSARTASRRTRTRRGAATAAVPKILVADDDRATRHLLRKLLTDAGFKVVVAGNGAEALKRVKAARFDLLLLDVWMPGMTGIDVLEKLKEKKNRSKAIVMTSDDTPGTLLQAVRAQACEYVKKPIDPLPVLQLVRRTLKEPGVVPIEVVSARPDWVELVAPCTREAAERVHGVVEQLDDHLAPDIRDAVGYAFRELLLNAVEWGGRLDPNRKVRIAYLRAKRMLLYRIADPGPGFKIEELDHAALTHPDSPIEHMRVREEKGLRPGGFGLLMVRAKVDELIYNEKRNEVVFVKYLD